MSLIFDWSQWAPYLEPKIKDMIENVDIALVDMLESSPKVNFINLGQTPPLVTLTKISTLTKEQQIFSVSLSYQGNMEFEVIADLNVNCGGCSEQATDAVRHMGFIFTSAPSIFHCRFHISDVSLTLVLEIAHGAQNYLRFEQDPFLSVSIDSNMCKVGPVFDSSLAHVVNMVTKSFSEMPKIIPLPDTSDAPPIFPNNNNNNNNNDDENDY